MSIYTPKTLDQAKEIASLISDNPRDCLRLHAAFGAHFAGDMAITQNNSFMLRGKASLNADAMAGIVRRSGLCRYMVITSWDDEHCTYENTAFRAYFINKMLILLKENVFRFLMHI